ncbi:MAG: hypothetical protein BCS36_09735 [Desulfovibrio sp. MES5]|uniref:hypothetical protein n=1 Tax=Desulfovibrio sp. MES5 TaxID=1899016 RepID=UPI000B9CFFE3|nr:hypothetical protein [Desulfovibrio sp. MES5]OXS29045.1 MAG: hypothetical protein BCS36_09735 [Desulfovibrio sp. MES5]
MEKWADFAALIDQIKEIGKLERKGVDATAQLKKNDELFAVYNELKDRFSDLLSIDEMYSCFPIIRESHDTHKFFGKATSYYASIDGMLFLITASHALDCAASNNIIVCIPGHGLHVLDVNLFIINKSLDLAVYPLSKDDILASKLRMMTPINVEESIGSLYHDEMFYVVGFEASKFKIKPNNVFTYEKPFDWMTLPRATPENLKPATPEIQSDSFFCMEYHRRKQNSLSANLEITGPVPRGVSGGPIYRIIPRDGTFVQLFTGMFIEYHEVYSVSLGIKGAKIVDYLRSIG